MINGWYRSYSRGRSPIRTVAALIAMMACTQAGAAPFSIQGPGVTPSDFRITTFAAGLDYPLGMAELSDGSLLVAINSGASFWSSTGKLVRLVDADRDGVADGPGVVLFTGLAGGLTSLHIGGNLIFVTGQGSGKPISVLRA